MYCKKAVTKIKIYARIQTAPPINLKVSLTITPIKPSTMTHLLTQWIVS